MAITVKKRKKSNTPMSGPGRFEEFRLQGFRDARDGVFHPEAYAKGMARRAYTHGKDQWVELMAQEK